MTPFVEAYTLLFGLDTAAVPLDGQMMDVLIDADVVEAATPVEEAQKFVEGHLKAEELYDFYALVRRAGAAKKAKP